MSWIDRIENIELEIITGDGKSYKPLWKNAEKEISFNLNSFNFIDTEGTYIERRKKQGNKYPILLYFQGDNNIEISKRFEESSKDSRPWTIKHPFYDNLLVQPLGLNFDNTNQNITIVKGVVWETLDVKFPSETVSILDDIEYTNSLVQSTSTSVFDAAINADAATATTAKNIIGKIDVALKNIATNTIDIEKYKDLVRTATGAAINILNSSENYIISVINLINFPFILEGNLIFRISSLLDSYDKIISLLLIDNDNEKNTFAENICANILGSICTIANSENYDYREQAVNVIDSITEKYASYLALFDNYSYLQNNDLAIYLDSIIYSTIGNLMQIVFDSKQKREYILPYDENIITLSHRFFGAGDDNIEKFIKINRIKTNEYLRLKAGRVINYYV